jgi:type IV pilus assembly protein PilM
MRRAGKTLVGLDIEPGYIAAVQSSAGRTTVEKAAVAELPADVVRDGEVLDPGALAEVLKKLFADHGLGSRIRIGIANQQIVVRTLDLPPITDNKQLASAVRFQAQDNIPMPLDQAVLEYQSLGIVGTAEGPKTRVVLVAARREMIDRLLSAARQAGLRPEGIDLSAFAMIRALYRAEDGEDPVAYVNLGGLTNLAVAVGTQCVFTRVIQIGTESMVADLAAQRGLTREHARGWLSHVGLDAELERIDGDREIVLAARTVLAESVVHIADEVRTTLDFHIAQAGSRTVERATLTGPGASLPGVADRFAQHTGLQVSVRTIERSAGALGGIDPAQVSVAAGLTTEEMAA